MTEIGEQIRQFRTAEGLSIRQLAEKSGVNHQTIYCIEKGQNSGQYETIKTILEAMGYSLLAVKWKEKE